MSRRDVRLCEENYPSPLSLAAFFKLKSVIRVESISWDVEIFIL